MTADSAQAWYTYSVLPASAGAPAGDGVLPGAPVEALRFGPLTVLGSLIPRALFDSGNSANRTADPAWMAARVEAHHAVNVAASQAGACLPLAFGALFSSLDLLGQWLQPRSATLLKALEQAAGQTEWALSLQEDATAHAAWLDREDPALKRLAEAAATAGEGTAFLLARRQDKARTKARSEHIDAVAATVETRLEAAGLGLLHEAPRDGLPGWTLLIPKPTPANQPAEQILGLTAELEPSGLSLRLSGPWPAYAFARAALAQEAVDV
jgi:hypothetical protein